MREREKIVRRIVSAGVIAQERTLAVDVVAESFFERILESLERGSYDDLLTWIDAACDLYANSPHIGSLLANASHALLETVGTFGPIAPELTAEFDVLERSIERIACRPHGQKIDEVEHVDEAGRLIHDLLAEMEATDPLTLEHSRAVSMWCSRIARRLALDERDVVHAGRCGLVHDFGKMKIAPAILHAPRSLTPQEWVAIRAHPAMGEEMVNAMEPLRPFAATVRSHHERLDGKGYPDGLGRSQISLTTRIVSVADAFNAMIGRRPYRLPMAPGEALDRLHAHSGTQFDPDVVAAMTEVVERADFG